MRLAAWLTSEEFARRARPALSLRPQLLAMALFAATLGPGSRAPAGPRLGHSGPRRPVGERPRLVLPRPGRGRRGLARGSGLGAPGTTAPVRGGGQRSRDAGQPVRTGGLDLRCRARRRPDDPTADHRVAGHGTTVVRRRDVLRVTRRRRRNAGARAAAYGRRRRRDPDVRPAQLADAPLAHRSGRHRGVRERGVAWWSIAARSRSPGCSWWRRTSEGLARRSIPAPRSSPYLARARRGGTLHRPACRDRDRRRTCWSPSWRCCRSGVAVTRSTARPASDRCPARDQRHAARGRPAGRPDLERPALGIVAGVRATDARVAVDSRIELHSRQTPGRTTSPCPGGAADWSAILDRRGVTVVVASANEQRR